MFVETSVRAPVIRTEAALPPAAFIHPEAPAVVGKSGADAFSAALGAATATPSVKRSPVAIVAATSFPGAGTHGLTARVPETDAVTAVTTPLRGTFFDHPEVSVSADGMKARVTPTRLAATVEGQGYVELTNTTALELDGQEHIFPRAVRPYTNELDLAHGKFNGPEDYVSDILAGKLEHGTAKLDKILLKSIPGKVVFEDPRISTVQLTPGAPPSALLSFTEYLPAEGAIRNRAVVLEPDGKGSFEKPAVDASGRPEHILNLSPEGVEAKNGLLYQNDEGQVVLRSRINGLGISGHYGEQVWVFKDWNDFQQYQAGWKNWQPLLEQGTREGALTARAPGGDVQPLRARVVANQDSFPEFYPQEKLRLRDPGAPKVHGQEPEFFRGFGPGARPMRLEREGNALFVSAGKGMPRSSVGEIPAAALADFPVPEGEVRLLTADHQLRALNVEHEGQTFPKRVYTMSFRLWDSAGDTPLRVYADAVQPLGADTRGGGILDLHHVYPVGWVPTDGATPEAPKRVAIWAGSADANSQRYEMDLPQLLAEMAPSSPRSQPLPGMHTAQVSDVVPFRALPATA